MKVVIIEPKFENGEVIENLRGKYDPTMAKVVPYHITLVYPFEDDSISFDELRNHVSSSVGNVRPFNIRLQCVYSVEDRYLFLDVVKGKSTLKELQGRLYRGVLQDYSNIPELRYEPHITLGRFDSKEELERALEEIGDLRDSFSANVNEISLAEVIKGKIPKVEKIRVI